jgi:hypothetical protein
MNFRLSSLFAISSLASALVVVSGTAAKPASAAPSFPCAVTKFFHASHCVRGQWPAGNLVVTNDGQIANTSTTPAEYYCPVTQYSMDTNPATWPVKEVQVHGWANSPGVTIQVCGISSNGGGSYCNPTSETASNTVYHKTLDATGIAGTDYMYIRVLVNGTSGGSTNTVFGYSITTYGNEHSTC